jgi:hypothetical protein
VRVVARYAAELFAAGSIASALSHLFDLANRAPSDRVRTRVGDINEGFEREPGPVIELGVVRLIATGCTLEMTLFANRFT